MPGAFKLDHLQPFKPILFLEFSICCTFIPGDHFLLPQRANTEKREITLLQKWMRQEEKCLRSNFFHVHFYFSRGNSNFLSLS